MKSTSVSTSNVKRRIEGEDDKASGSQSVKYL
jgi:hypothetical protein